MTGALSFRSVYPNLFISYSHSEARHQGEDVICQQAHIRATNELAAKIDPLAKIEPKLVMMFGAPSMFAAGGLVERACKSFPKAITIGCTTAGEITAAGVSDDTLAVTAMHFEKSMFTTAQTEVKSMSDSHAAGERLGQMLNAPDLKAIFVLGPGVDVDGSALIDGIRAAVGKSDVVITGGLAADQGKFQRTFTVLNGKIHDKNVVAVGFRGDSVRLAFGSMGGWEPFGISRKVTKAKRNVLYEIDGEPALAFYKRLLGKKAEGLPASGLYFPFDVLDAEDSPSGIIRTILGVSELDQSLILAGDIEKAKWIRLMRATNDGLERGARTAAVNVKTLAQAKPGVGILISCVGRKLIMGHMVSREVQAVREVLGHDNLVGFYSNGEICPQQGFQECKLHNQTMTISYLYEA